MTTSKTYCKLSHVSLAVQNQGDCCVCNKNTSSISNDEHGTAMYLADVGLQAMWDSPSRTNIAKRLDQGEKVESCHACWDDEAAGVESFRMLFNRQLVDLVPMEDQPRILILKPSNVCNLGCRTCQPSTSSGLYQDFYKLETKQGTFTGDFKNYTAQFETIRDGFSARNLAMWDTFERWIPGLTFLDIYGGEPMLAPPMWERMIRAANEGKTANTGVRIHTNGTIWNQDYMDCLPKYKNVKIGISIDAVDHKHLGYVRHGVNVDRLTQHLKKYIALSKSHANISVYICFTVSIFNIWYLDSILKELSSYGVGVGVNVVYSPEQYDFRHLPQSIKDSLIERFSNYDGMYKDQVNNVVRLLRRNIPGCNIYFPKFWRELQDLDAIRNESFKDVMPEYYEALVTAEPWLLDAN